MELVADVSPIVVAVHLLLLAGLALRGAVVYFRRLSLLYKTRTNEPRASWLRLLQMSLGLTKF